MTHAWHAWDPRSIPKPRKLLSTSVCSPSDLPVPESPQNITSGLPEHYGDPHEDDGIHSPPTLFILFPCHLFQLGLLWIDNAPERNSWLPPHYSVALVAPFMANSTPGYNFLTQALAFSHERKYIIRHPHSQKLNQQADQCISIKDIKRLFVPMFQSTFLLLL